MGHGEPNAHSKQPAATELERKESLLDSHCSCIHRPGLERLHDPTPTQTRKGENWAAGQTGSQPQTCRRVTQTSPFGLSVSHSPPPANGVILAPPASRVTVRIKVNERQAQARDNDCRSWTHTSGCRHPTGRGPSPQDSRGKGAGCQGEQQDLYLGPGRGSWRPVSQSQTFSDCDLLP